MVHNTSVPNAYDATRYRPDVDGLRAVAVLSVLANHIGIPLFSGGYVGVDIFFVISGFLIINQIATHVAAGTFSFGAFWARRTLRILPPYLLVIAASAVIASYVLAAQEEFDDFTRQVRYSALMLVNHLFLRQQGYFDADADFKPLLHLWSLAVEEQFYIVAPIALVALAWLWRGSSITRHVAIGAVVLITALSFALCVSLTGGSDDKNYAFYLMPLRMWEFVAGGAIALAAPYAARLPRRALEALGFAGAALIAISVVAFDDKTRFPGVAVSIPVLGACLLILVGMSHRGTRVSGMLSTPLMVGIGLISYSWYLWHWPLLAFGRIYNLGDRDLAFDALLGGGLSLVLAIGTYRLVEKPIRSWGRRSGARLGWKQTFSGIAACGLAAASAPLQAAVAPAVDIAIPDKSDTAYPECRLAKVADFAPCLTAAAGRPMGVVIGDSHAGAAYGELNAYANKQGLFLANSSFAGCAPLLGVIHVLRSNSSRCLLWHENAAENIIEMRPKFAIVAAQWRFHVRAGMANEDGILQTDRRAFFVESLRETVASLKASGAERVLVVAPIPLWERSAPRCRAHELKHGIDPAGPCGWSYDRVMKQRATAMEWLSEAVSGLDSVRLADPIEAFCDDEACRPYDGKTLLYSDHSPDKRRRPTSDYRHPARSRMGDGWI